MKRALSSVPSSFPAVDVVGTGVVVAGGAAAAFDGAAAAAFGEAAAAAVVVVVAAAASWLWDVDGIRAGVC